MIMKTPQQKAKSKYEEKRRNKSVSFNIKTEKDLLNFANNIVDFSDWVKQTIKEDKDFNQPLS